MDLQVILPWLLAAITIANFGDLLKRLFSSGEKQLSKDIEELKKAVIDGMADVRVQQAGTTAKLTDHDRRIQAIEGELKHLPDRDTAHRLELAMEKISGRLDTLDEKLKPIAATNERMNELLVEQARK